MLYTVIDIETGGFRANTSDLYSFAYLTFDDVSQKVVEADTLYFYQPWYEFNQAAYEVNKISREDLIPHEDKYRENYNKMYKVMYRSNIVGFNSKTFDVPYIMDKFMQEGLEGVIINSHTDIMNVFKPVMGKRPKLSELTAYLGFNEVATRGLLQLYFPENSYRHMSHDAAYDVATTYMAFSIAKSGGML